MEGIQGNLRTWSPHILHIQIVWNDGSQGEGRPPLGEVCPSLIRALKMSTFGDPFLIPRSPNLEAIDLGVPSTDSRGPQAQESLHRPRTLELRSFLFICCPSAQGSVWVSSGPSLQPGCPHLRACMDLDRPLSPAPGGVVAGKGAGQSMPRCSFRCLERLLSVMKPLPQMWQGKGRSVPCSSRWRLR